MGIAPIKRSKQRRQMAAVAAGESEIVSLSFFLDAHRARCAETFSHAQLNNSHGARRIGRAIT